MVFNTKQRLRKLETNLEKLDRECAELALRFLSLKRDINRVFSRVSRDFIVHSEKLDPDKEKK